MKKEGMVSLWLGTCESHSNLDQYLEIKYSEDGDRIPSEFMRDFNLKRYDEDFIEVEFLDEFLYTMSSILSGFSYDEIIISRFIELHGETVSRKVNAVILLYNYHYDNAIIEINNKFGSFTYYGAVSYR